MLYAEGGFSEDDFAEGAGSLLIPLIFAGAILGAVFGAILGYVWKRFASRNASPS